MEEYIKVEINKTTVLYLGTSLVSSVFMAIAMKNKKYREIAIDIDISHGFLSLFSVS